MEIQATQLHQQIDQTRTATTAELDLLKQYVLQKVPATVEQTVIAPVRSLQETTTKGATLLHQYRWLIIAGEVLFGYYLSSTLSISVGHKILGVQLIDNQRDNFRHVKDFTRH